LKKGKDADESILFTNFHQRDGLKVDLILCHQSFSPHLLTQLTLRTRVYVLPLGLSCLSTVFSYVALSGTATRADRPYCLVDPCRLLMLCVLVLLFVYILRF